MRTPALMLSCLLLTLASAGCDPPPWARPQPPPAPVMPTTSPPTTASAPATMAAPVAPRPPVIPAPTPAPMLPVAAPAGAPQVGGVMATINGRPIYMEELTAPLVEAGGGPIAEILVANVLVAQEATRLNITVTDEDVRAEHDRSLRSVIRDDLPADQRQRVLDQLLQQRGLTRGLWQAIMRRNALLRKMAEPRVDITEAMLQAEFARVYGEKVRASHIQLPSLEEAQKVLALVKDGQDFGTLARKYSTNSATAKDNGALIPFSRDNPSVPRALREAAFALQPGQVGGIVQSGNDFHVLKLHEKLAPPQADYEAVKERLRKDLHAATIEGLQGQIVSELQKKAEIEFVNPILKQAMQKAAGQ